MDNQPKIKDAVQQLQEKPSKSEFLIIGIGASAGGVQVLQEFFKNVPEDSGMAYVVILHLSPDHDSQLAKILQATTKLPVSQVVEKVKIEPDHVYVVPPNQHLTMDDGFIHTSINMATEDRRAPVDIFFRSLGDEHGPRAIAVILSGTGANGSMGLKRIKERGGACFVQNPREAEYNEMPRNAIATELVDEVLPVSAIPGKLVAYKQSLGSIQIVEEVTNHPEAQQQALREIFTQLRVRTGHDFSNYKRPTLLRRIERRVNVRGLSDLQTYAGYMQEQPEEATALLKDLLISVTNFFRDKQPFEILEREVLPVVFKGKTNLDQVRIWVAGCATGEEAYSIAMLCAEIAMNVTNPPKIQIFATDIDESGIALAREGLYSINDAADVSTERLRRFFSKEGDHYRISRQIRETVMFAHHNFLKDPPFSHLDLISCRNVLIYLNHVAQDRVTETFHFALNPGGFLFLGTSESIDLANDLYASFNREKHIYQSRQASKRTYPLPDPTVPLLYDQYRKDPVTQEQRNKILERISFGDLHQQLLEQYAPPSVVINEEYDILHLTERAGKYLQVSGGELSRNLLKLVKPELRLELRSALYQAKQLQAAVETKGLQVHVDNKPEIVNVHIRPVVRVDDTAREFILVLFETTTEEEHRQILLSSDEPVARQLEEELIRLKSQLRSSNEQHDFQAEEMKATNEELQAMNEELRSSTEELETSKEELQSINEELRTVNQELKIKVEETSIYSNNLQNLINSTDIGTIFLDRSFRVILYTPASSAIFNLISSDYGRPLTDITSRLENTDVISDAEIVLERLSAIEREVRTKDGNIFMMRITPYRTDKDRIRGVVFTFLDITERKKNEIALETAAGFSAFRIALNEALQPLDHADTIQAVAGKLLRETLHADRVYFAERNTGDEYTIAPDHDQDTGVVDQWGRHPVSRFSKTIYHTLLGNHRMVTSDVLALPEEPQSQKAEYTLHDIRAFIAQPIPNANEVKAILWVTRSTVHEWTAREISFVSETAERTWAAVERFRAEEALRKAEQKYRRQLEKEVQERTRELRESKDLLQSVFDSTISHISVLKSIYDPQGKITDFELTFVNKATLSAFDFDPVGKTYRKLYLHLIPYGMINRISQTIETGLTQDFELFVDQKGRNQWLHVVLIRLNEGVVVISEDITARKETEQEMHRMKDELTQRTSDKYYSIFNSIDESFAYCEIILDTKGNPVNYRLLEANPAFEDMAQINPGNGSEGIARALIAGTGDRWIGTYGKVALTGESIRFEHYLPELDSWFDIFAAPVGEKGNGRFALVFRDITGRKRSEAHLKFIAEISEDLVGLTSTEDAMKRLSRKIGTYLNTVGCIFLEINEPADEALILHDWHQPGMQDAMGSYPISTLVSPEFTRLCQEGAVIAVNDTAASSLVQTQRVKDEFGSVSFIAVPLQKSGVWIFMLAVYDAIPRLWRDDEITLLRDLTIRIWTGLERAISDEALRLSEARLRSTMESAIDYAIINIDTEGLITGWNSGAERTFQYTFEEVAGRPTHIIYLPEDIATGIPEQEITTALQHGRAADERWHVRKDGTRLYMSGVLTPVYNPNVTGYVKVAKDMTEQQKAETNLKMLEERYRIALKSAEMAAWDWDILNDTVVWNEQHYYLFGIQPDGHMRKSADFLAFVYPGDADMVITALRAAVEQTGVYQCDFRIRRADDGKIRWMKGYGKAINQLGAKVTRMVGVMYDITTHKELEQQKEDFIGIASHELKTPVTSIKAYTELLQDLFVDTGDALQTGIVQKLDAQVDRLIDLIHTLLDTTKIAQGQLPLNPELFSINGLIMERIEDLQRLTDKHQLVFTSVDDVMITADKERISQVFTNLITNAIKYSPRGGEILVNLSAQEKLLEVSVRDRGIGIAEDMLQKVFERFFRATDAEMQTFPGMGLGLYITASIIRRHRGMIWAESKKGEGSTFYFRIPIHFTHEDHENSDAGR